MSEWFITDDDCLQCCKPLPEISPQAFEFVQIISLPGHVDGKPFWNVAHAEISVADASDEEIRDTLNFFGYEDMADFIEQNAPAGSEQINYQLIAEMLFETDALPHYCESQHFSWNDAVKGVSDVTGLNLSGFLEQEKSAEAPEKKSLADRIASAENRTAPTDKTSATREHSR